MAPEEGTFSRQDAAPATGPTGGPPPAAQDTMLGAEGATTPPAPPEAGAAAPTPDQINEWKQAYENRQEWQRANTQEAQRIARERAEIQQWREWTEQLQHGYEHDPNVRAFVDGFNQQRTGQSGQPAQPTGGVPAEGQQAAQSDPAIMQRLAEYDRRLQQFEHARDAEWADKVMADAQTEFQSVMRRNWTYQEHQRLSNDLARTGSIDPKAQMFWTFRNEFAQAGNVQAQQNVAAAQAAAAGAQVEGTAGGDQAHQIDLRTAPEEVRRKLALNAIGGNPDDDSHPWIYNKPK